MGVILVRHANNENNDYVDLVNPGITESGKEMSKILDMSCDLVICSNLRSARETLDHSNIKYKNVIFTDLIREIKNDSSINYYNDEPFVPESKQEIDQRLQDINDYLKMLNNKYPNIIVLSHFELLKYLTSFNFGSCWHMTYTPK